LLKFDLNLQVFTDLEAQEVDWMKVGMNFISNTYCGRAVDSLSKL